MIDEYSEKFTELDKQRKEIIQKAKNQANMIVESANKVIEKTIRDIKEAKADAEKTKKARENVTLLKEELKEEIASIEHEESLKPIVPVKRSTPKPKRVEAKPEDSVIRVGDSVFMADMQVTGEVTAISGNEATIAFNSISFRTDIRKLAKISKREAREVRRGGVVHYNEGTLGEAMNKKLANFSTTLDVRGQRADELITNLEEYLDEAALLSISTVRVLHGKGNGILRQITRQELAKRKDVESFRDEALEFGGSGITVVKMRI